MTENTPGRTCPKCGEPKPVREFRIYDEQVLFCRACRHRDLMKHRERDKRATLKLKARLRARNEGSTVYRDKKLAEARLRFIKTHFLAATAVTRRRIKAMKQQEEPSIKTKKALVVREELLSRYEQAYEKQKKMVAAGAVPPNIHDMV